MCEYVLPVNLLYSMMYVNNNFLEYEDDLDIFILLCLFCSVTVKVKNIQKFRYLEVVSFEIKNTKTLQYSIFRSSSWICPAKCLKII